MQGIKRKPRIHGCGMGFLIAGIIVLLLGAVLHSYCAIGMKASPIYSPKIFYTHPTLLQASWVVLFLIGVALLFVFHWIAGIVGIFTYWFVLPLFVSPIMKKWMLPSWDELSDNLKGILKQMGYDEKNYLKGNWWQIDMVGRE